MARKKVDLNNCKIHTFKNIVLSINKKLKSVHHLNSTIIDKISRNILISYLLLKRKTKLHHISLTKNNLLIWQTIQHEDNIEELTLNFLQIIASTLSHQQSKWQPFWNQEYSNLTSKLWLPINSEFINSE